MLPIRFSSRICTSTLAALAFTASLSAQEVRPPQPLGPALPGADNNAFLYGRPEIVSEGDLSIAIWRNSSWELVASVSDGRGLEWSPAATIQTASPLGTRLSIQEIRVVEDSIYVLWHDHDLYTYFPPCTWFFTLGPTFIGDDDGTGRLHLAVSHDRGASWNTADVPSGLAIGDGEVMTSTLRVEPGPDPSGAQDRVLVVQPQYRFSDQTYIAEVAESIDGGASFVLRSVPDVGSCRPEPVATDTSLGLFSGASSYRRSLDEGLTWEAPVALGGPNLDEDDTLIGSAVSGGRIALLYRDLEMTGLTTVEIRTFVLVSEDDGASFGPPRSLFPPGMESFGTDVAWSESGLIVAREGGVSFSDDAGATWTHTEYTIDVPLLAFRDDVGVLLADPETRTTLDGGRTWSEPLSTPQTTPFSGFSGLALGDLYQNVLFTWVDVTTDTPSVSGYRPQRNEVVGYTAGGANIRFEVSGFDPVESPFVVVALGLDTATGQYVIPDGRDMGLTFDALSAADSSSSASS